MKALLFNLLGVVVLVSACGYNNTELPQGFDSTAGAGGLPTFSTVSQQVLRPYCTDCHSNAGGNPFGVNLETYANTKPILEEIWDAVESCRMPKSGCLPDNAKSILEKWIQSGAQDDEKKGS